MVEHIFEKVAPQRPVLFLLFGSLCYTSIAGFKEHISAEIVPGCLAPDFSITGYKAQQALDWYEAIGEDGRWHYVVNYPADLFLVFSYVMLMGSQIYMSTLAPKSLCYLPVAAAFCDFVETTTHAIATFMYPDVPSELALNVAGYATVLKHILFNSSALLSVGCLFLWKKTDSDGKKNK